MKKENSIDQNLNEGLEKTKGLINEFKQFALRGNVVDMAVGVIIGGAFGGIISSFVDDLIMPFVGMLISGKDFSNMVIHFGDSGTINYGLFIQKVVNFFLIALVVFIMVKIMNSIIRKKEEVAPVTQLDVLMEIRDLLKEDENEKEEEEEGELLAE